MGMLKTINEEAFRLVEQLTKKNISKSVIYGWAKAFNKGSVETLSQEEELQPFMKLRSGLWVDAATMFNYFVAKYLFRYLASQYYADSKTYYELIKKKIGIIGGLFQSLEEEHQNISLEREYIEKFDNQLIRIALLKYQISKDKNLEIHLKQEIEKLEIIKTRGKKNETLTMIHSQVVKQFKVIPDEIDAQIKIVQREYIRCLEQNTFLNRVTYQAELKKLTFLVQFPLSKGQIHYYFRPVSAPNLDHSSSHQEHKHKVTRPHSH